MKYWYDFMMKYGYASKYKFNYITKTWYDCMAKYKHNDVIKILTIRYFVIWLSTTLRNGKEHVPLFSWIFVFLFGTDGTAILVSILYTSVSFSARVHCCSSLWSGMKFGYLTFFGNWKEISWVFFNLLKYHF